MTELAELEVYDPRKRRKVHVGQYCRQEKRFFALRDKPGHYVDKYEGYAIQENVLVHLYAIGCRFIVVITASNELETSIERWKDEGVTDDLGHGRQVFLPEAKMVSRRQEKLF